MTLRTKRKSSPRTIQRPTLLTCIKFTDKLTTAVDEQFIWDELQRLFKDHPTLEVTQLETRPDTEGSTINEEE